MRYLLAFLVICAFIFPGCIIEPSVSVSLATPQDGSSVPSLTPTLTWGGGGSATSYRVMIATDNNFQSLAVDASNIGDLSYNVPAGKLNSNSIYYWKVIARQGDKYSNWTAPWSFSTPGGVSPTSKGNVRVSATLDGSPWSGSVNYQVSGPFTDTDNSVPWDFKNIATGTYTVTYNYGGPSNAALASITPSPTQELQAGGSVHFILNFHRQTNASLTINATLNGSPWSGNVKYSFSGPYANSDISVPQTFNSVPSGTYTLTYKSGGPAGAMLSSISPSPSQTLTSTGSIVFTMNFSTVSTSNLSITAVYNGTSWSGPVQYTISGPINNDFTTVPMQINNAPPGTYNIFYHSGGPSGATLGSVAPGPSLLLSSGSSAGFIFNYFATQQTGNIVVNATLNGSPWSGIVNYSISGPFHSNDSQVPRTYNGVPTGNYSLTYNGGGPSGAFLSSITPAPAQSLANGRTIVFNLNFNSQPSTGTIIVNALLDGKPWVTQVGSGSISYSITGPSFDSGNAIPGNFTNMPAGNYTLSYNSGGPVGATLTGISPSPAQNLRAGGSIAYTLNFTGQARGYVSVQATIDGSPWSGSVGYVLSGPYVESGQSAPRTFSNAPEGNYTLQYRAGGPPGCEFVGVSPSSQYLSPGGNIDFVIMFHYQGLRPEPEPQPMPGPLPPVPEPEPEPGPLLK